MCKYLKNKIKDDAKFLVFDIGGTYIKYGILNDKYQILYKNKAKNNFDQNNNELLVQQLKNIFHGFLQEYEISGVAISTFGIVNEQNDQVIFAGHHRKKYCEINFKEIFNHLPIYIENDVNSALIGEKYFGALVNESDAFMITLGTGIGGALLINNQLYKGKHNAAAEVGMMIFNNQNSAWEENASASSLLKKIEKDSIHIKEIIQQWYKDLALGIFNICTIFNPNKFVIGGGISQKSEFDLSQIKNYLKQYLDKSYALTFDVDHLLVAQLGNDAALYGVLFLLLNKLAKQK